MKYPTPLTALFVFSYLYLAISPAALSAAGQTVLPVSNDSVPAAPIQEELMDDALTGNDDEYQDLDDFVIVQQKKLVESDGAKLSYNVSEDPESASSNVLDILRKVPGVSVDAEGNIKVKGQSSFKILMNGREDPMLKGDLKTILKSIPAGTIKKIEVISEPGAKYEAEGTGGILNIVTDRSRSLSGFMTQVSAFVNTFNVGGYANGRVKLDKVMLDATLSYSNGYIWNRPSSSKMISEDLTGEGIPRLEGYNKGHSGWDYFGARANMSWEPDTLNLFTASINYGLNRWGSKADGYRAAYDADLSELWHCDRFTDNTGDYNGVGTSVSYQHSFGRDDHTFVATYEYDYYDSAYKEVVNTVYTLGVPAIAPFAEDRTQQYSNAHIFQLDYSNQFSPKHLLEVGAKGNLNLDKNITRALYGTDRIDAVVDDASRLNVDQFKDIYSVYASYSGKYAKWSVKGGLRYEMTHMGMRYHVGNYDSFTTNLHDWVPNAAISYAFTDASSLRAAYQMRISRPGLGVLSPFKSTLRPGEVKYGNPDLKSVRMHNVSLGYSNYEGKFTGEVKFNYRLTDNLITDIIFAKDGVINTTYANVGRSDMFSLELNGDWNITSALRWSLYLSGNYEYLKADSELLHQAAHGFQGYVNTNVTYTFPSKLRLNAYGGCWSPWLDLQTKGSSGYYYGLSASKSFLKDDALSISLGVGNLLPPKRTNHYVQESETVRYSNWSTWYQWNASLSISWKFGGLKSSVKQTAANVEKEEAAKSGSGNKN